MVSQVGPVRSCRGQDKCDLFGQEWNMKHM